MFNHRILIIMGVWLATEQVHGLWSCSSDVDCSSLSGSVCADGSCVCSAGTQVVAGGSRCDEIAPYHTSPCVEDFQCQRLFTGFHCRMDQEDGTGTCRCLPGHHYLKGRCWLSKDFGEECSRDEECFGVIRDVNSMVCEGVCHCAEGFFERQRGECRRAALVEGDGCVLDQDCLFPNGACNLTAFTCYTRSELESPDPEDEDDKMAVTTLNKMTATTIIKTTARQHGVMCGASNPCEGPFVCSSFGVCICPLGYYASENGSVCLAELESPSTEDQCVGLFSVVANDVCTCPANFFFEESMRDCIKVARFITDACLFDESCHTFGAAARCGAPQPPWGIRLCECDSELAVWDDQRSMCRLFAGIGEECVVDSDCLAGTLEIQCVKDDDGHGVCACPEGLAEFEGLCITAGLELGDACQVSQECTGTANSVCVDSQCSCDSGYQQVDDICAPVIGGVCTLDSDCVIENTVCSNDTGEVWSCRCEEGFVEQEVCWPAVSGIESPCNVTAQCTAALGEASECADGVCACLGDYHHRDNSCWPKTGLFEGCSRQSECYLGELTERVVCRNSICQCDFRYPYSEQLNTCTSSASAISASFAVFTTVIAIFYL